MNFPSINVLHGFKTGVAALLAYVITTFLDIEFGYWAVLSAVIVMQVYVADSVEMCLYRFSGSLTGAVMGVAVLAVTPKTVFFIGLALFVTIGICSFLTRYNTRYRMAAITVVIVVMTGVHAQDIYVFALFRVLEIGIGILCAFAVSVLVFPQTKVDVLKNRLEAQAKACSDKCAALVDAFVSRQQNVDPGMVDDLVKDSWDNHELLQKINQHEAMIYHKKFNDNYAHKVSIMSRSVEHLRNMVRTLNSLDGNGQDIIMARELEKLAEASGRALVSIMKNESVSLADRLEDMVTAMDIRLLGIRKKGLIRRFDSKKLVQVFSFYSSLTYFAEDILAGIRNR